MCQFIDISNQMETTGEVSSVEQKNYIMPYYIKKFFRLRYCDFYVMNSANRKRHIVAIHKLEFEFCIELAS